MKKLCILFVLMLSAGLLRGQNSGFNYKAVISENGNVLANQSISMRFTILENGSTPVYREIQTGTTDANGIVVFHIGEGTVVLGNFSTIDWSAHTYFLKTELDTGSGFQNFGMTEFKWVPYAKYAAKAGNVFSGDFNDLTNVPPGLSDGDDDTHLTEAEVDAYVANNGYLTQVDNIRGTPVSATPPATGEILKFNGTEYVPAIDQDTHLTDTDISAMGYIKNPDDADHDPANELQSLTLTGNQLEISNGNSVTFSNWDTDATDDVQELNDLADAKAINFSVGIGNGALQNLSSGGHNVAVGAFAGQNNTNGSGNVFIGYQAGVNEHGSNKLYIDNSGTPNPLIYGDFSTNELTINGSLIIKDGTQGAGKVLVSDANGKAHWANAPVSNKIYLISPLDAKAIQPGDASHLVKDYRYGAYFDVTGNKRMYFPIRLPEGAQISSITFHYRIPAFWNDFVFRLLREDINNTNLAYNIATINGGYQSQSVTINFSSPVPIDHAFDYFIEVYKSDWSGNDDTGIKAIEIHYIE